MTKLWTPPNSTKLTLSNKIPLLSWWSEVDSGTNSNPTLASQMKSATCPNSKDNLRNSYLFFNDFVHSGLIAQGPGLEFLLKTLFPATQWLVWKLYVILILKFPSSLSLCHFMANNYHCLRKWKVTIPLPFPNYHFSHLGKRVFGSPVPLQIGVSLVGPAALLVLVN